MTVEQLINKLKDLPLNMTVVWVDAVEGNDCEMQSVEVKEYIDYSFVKKDGYELMSECQQKNTYIKKQQAVYLSP